MASKPRSFINARMVCRIEFNVFLIMASPLCGIAASDLSEFLSSFLVQDSQSCIACVCLHRGLVHQLGARGRDAKFAGYLNAHRILERRVAVEIVFEDHGPRIAKLAHAVPITP